MGLKPYKFLSKSEKKSFLSGVIASGCYGLAVAEQNTAKKPIFWARRTRKRAYHRFEWSKVVKPKKLFVRACWRIKKTLDPLRCTQRLAFGGGGTRKGASHIAEKRKTPASPGQRQNARPYL